MSIDRELLIRYLRQFRDFGEEELMLDSLPATEALAALRPRPGPLPSWREVLGTAPSIVPAERSATTEAGGAAVASSGGANVLRVLAAEAAGCTRCRLHEGRRNVVFGEGAPTAELVIIGEAPGGEEDRTGRPFVGPAGKLLDLLLMTAGFRREDVYICNVLKCRPPNNRDPAGDEVAQCSSYLRRQLEAIRPRVLLAAGRFAVQTLLETDRKIGSLRGEIHVYQGIPLIATYHPAFLLRSPQWMRAAWQDLQLVRQVLDAA